MKTYKYSHILNAFYNSVWMIREDKLRQIQSLLHMKAQGGEVSAAEIEEVMAARRTMPTEVVGRVAIVPVFGVLSQRVSMLDEASGGIGTEQIGATLDTLMNDKQVKKILMVYDSPGGSAFGVDELASKIRAYREEKPIVGIADSEAHSAGYYLLSQSSEVYITPGGQLGNIGTLIAYVDTTEMEKKLGVNTEIISYPEFKGELWQPLTKEARADLEGKVKEYYAKFVTAVAKGRGTTEAKVEKGFGRGRSVLAKDAVDRGMADRIATFEQVLKRMGAETSLMGGPRSENAIVVSGFSAGVDPVQEGADKTVTLVVDEDGDLAEALDLDIKIRKRSLDIASKVS